MDHSPLRPDLPHLPAERVRVRRDALLREIAPARRRSVTPARRRLAVVAVGLATLAAAGTAAVVAGRPQAPQGTAAPPSASASASDGTVTVTLADAADPARINEELRRTGVRATLVKTRPEAACPPEDRGTEVQQDLPVIFGPDAAVTLNSPEAGLLAIHPDRIPAGLMLAVHLRQQEVNGSYLAGWSFYRLPGPGCVVAGAYRSFDEPAPSQSGPR
ncbi:hypothetical protein [Micromonospora purpureochromogenes]|uniref:Uncharacterized protein n=1 Tax=Micromonospora purpureochromogenes TaxID=47872 RepID=A0ABX2RNW5_9ACTN|nr:hypothetical protein [Micromonospora purpureochromogenes]NYF56831.1 hypothetical protein [Micromonospora purpureochromogenes]